MDSLMVLSSLLLQLQVWKQPEISGLPVFLAADRIVHTNGIQMTTVCQSFEMVQWQLRLRSKIAIITPMRKNEKKILMTTLSTFSNAVFK